MYLFTKKKFLAQCVMGLEWWVREIIYGLHFFVCCCLFGTKFGPTLLELDFLFLSFFIYFCLKFLLRQKISLIGVNYHLSLYVHIYRDNSLIWQSYMSDKREKEIYYTTRIVVSMSTFFFIITVYFYI